MKKIVTDPFFEVVITFCILANTFFMTLEKYPKENYPEREPLLDKANKVFTIIFIVEMVLKIIGLTPHLYFKEQWNIFDSVVIMFSILELALSTLATNLAVLRAFRLLRILKLAKSWPTLNKLIRIIGRSLGNLGHLSFVLFIVLFIFAVIGMQLFRADYLKHFNDGMEVNETTKIHLPRWHFIDFPHAFLIVFRIQCGEWVESMFECMKVSKPKICIPIFITVFVIGNLVILNLFLALLLNSFSGDVLQQTEASSNAFALAGERIQRCIVHVAKKIPVCLGSCQQFALAQWKKHFAVTTIKEPTNPWDDEFIPIKAGVCGVSDAFSRSPSLSKAYIHTLVLPNEASNGTSPNKSLNNLSNPDAQYLQQQQEIQSTENAALLEGKQYNPEECLPKLTPYLNKYIDPESHFSQQCMKIRINCYKIVEHRIYETILIFTILLSSIALVFEDIKLNDQRSSLKVVLYWADVFFCIFFSIEMIMKVIAYGLRKYFTNWWCCLDFFIVTVSVISIYYSPLPHSKVTNSTTSSLSVLRVLRTMRALRPLRALSRFQGMRVVVDALMKAIPSIMNVFLVCVIFWLIFSILGVNLFGGKFSRCVDLKTSQILPAKCPLLRGINGSVSEADKLRCKDRKDPMFAEWAADKHHCLYIKEWFNDTEKNESKYDWETPPVNFDDVWNGYLALLQGKA
ncbi:Oidioi.mRNA.OKI2018_I69.chr1.g3165.t1.cds [Oikopleura dioica]|uniref:Oidioi.mRNA.OKI2018_I69.chr1.g3165.t1.cds n=1 Tax=Oikopleura dioica TaxID=34765 RepID=A0ABN7T054_OIKDI|nr:Oidioi.mRNA.OKI2018_I69.chr1.g3165.t1.cds [Oikopleura dioica]